ncbi:MAG: oxidoreductase [Planctomycetaceae bacterium]|nr:oxidoreductase [Planctomycetaceae bacterium]
MSRLKVAVVGAGALGRHHVRILSGLDNVELVAVAELNEALGRPMVEQFGTRWVADFHEIIDQVEAASIVVPTTAHLKIATPFLEHGVPLLIEKPLAADLQQSEQIVRLSEAHNVPVQVGHVERFNPAFVAASERCESPKYIRAERVSPFTFRSTDIGVVHDLMIHDIDLVLNLVQDRVVRVEAFGLGLMGDFEDCAQARLHFEGGCIADLVASRINPGAARQMQIWSAAGCVNVDFTSREVRHAYPTETLKFGTSPVERARQPDADIEQLKRDVFESFIKIDSPSVSDADALTAELSSFVDAISSGTPVSVDSGQALKAMQVAEQVVSAINAHAWDGQQGHLIGPFPQPVAPLKQAG